MVTSTLHARLNAATRSLSYRQLADKTDTNHETTRRYLNGAAPSAEFLAAVCARLSISGEWLLTGQGPMHAASAKAAARRQAEAAHLLTSVTASLGELAARVQRLEVFLQTIETHLDIDHSPVKAEAKHDALTHAATTAPARARAIANTTRAAPQRSRGAAR
ncbi:MAG: hypothetical protein ACKVS8_03350 [Phycisphaerales bacterium]